jgi:DNA-3-methyladenine glycosylase II
MSIKIKRVISATYPEHGDLFNQLKTVPKLKPRDIPLPEAVVRVVTGQMLSGAAAQTIYNRVAAAAAERELVGSWQLDFDVLRSCGLSGAKAKNICAFGARVGDNESALEHWRTLDVDSLIQEVRANQGMGDWTASILALFYVGHEDVFPTGDGSLRRAIAALQLRGTKRSRRYKFDPDQARPFRSYLALYLWQALDTGMLD